MVPEAAFAMLACARIGAIHSVVFGGFSPEALKDRISDAACRLVITADEGLRGGKTVPLKRNVDQALKQIDCVDSVATLSTQSICFKAWSTLRLRGTVLPPRKPSSAVITSRQAASLMRSFSASGENPPNTTE